ncbi:DUF2971 domain-containing protein [Chryseobacterium formosus]|uniref:DUF2971 domain-containing protein n=1 Tax=Chryseobacterium formosus TaxID=1537363 RepID=A0ABT3XS22_9FLAO|nr:DUF2971 domain-containing protein [Chryseobacterium formosus]MCX8523962.1 DUF2971 domain-containing protein [Chryseobacterium formosus]
MILFKYRSIEFPNNDETFSENFLRDVKCLLFDQIWFSSLKALNDPFEGVFKFDRSISKMMKGFKKDLDTNKIERAKDNYLQLLKDNSGILSLTTDNQNLLMWSHYTNNQKGYCIEYDFEEEKFLYANKIKNNKNDISLKKVLYSDNYVRTNILNNDYQLIFGNKSRCWSYEKEFRFISKNIGLHKFQNGCLKAIYLGADCDFVNETLISSIAYLKGAKVYKAKLFKDKFKLYFLPYDLDALNKNINCKNFVQQAININLENN